MTATTLAGILSLLFDCLGFFVSPFWDRFGEPYFLSWTHIASVAELSELATHCQQRQKLVVQIWKKPNNRVKPNSEAGWLSTLQVGIWATKSLPICLIADCPNPVNSWFVGSTDPVLNSLFTEKLSSEFIRSKVPNHLSLL